MEKENYINKKQKREKTFPDKLNRIIKNIVVVIIWISIFGKILFIFYTVRWLQITYFAKHADLEA